MGAKVPQNITREDRIVGPFTLKQFLYVLAGGSLIFILYHYYAVGFLYPAELVIYGGIVIAIVAALAFGKINGRNFEVFLGNLWRFIFKPKSRVWEKEPADILPRITVQDVSIKDTKTEASEVKSGKDIKGQLDSLANVLDTGGTMNKDEAGGTERIGSLTNSQPKLSEEGLNVEDLFED